MERTLSALAVRWDFGTIPNRVAAERDEVVERRGGPVAAIVPIGVYRRFKRAP